MSSPFENMDKMYRHQRYFYDLTRKYYLLGRDDLIKEMKIAAGETVLEIGCGTGRNLMILARENPQTFFYGLDASAAMLETAQSKIEARRLSNITLKNALADDYDYRKTFGSDTPFDTLFFSYSITMIPAWREAIRKALANLKAGKSLYIVDFYDQRDFPRWFQRLLQGWLRRFQVVYPKELVPFLESLEKESLGKFSVTSIFRSYAFIVRFTKAG